MYDNGYTLEKIAEVLLLSHEGIRKHLKDYHGESKLSTVNRGNYSKLNEVQESKLIEYLVLTPIHISRDFGLILWYYTCALKIEQPIILSTEHTEYLWVEAHEVKALTSISDIVATHIFR